MVCDIITPLILFLSFFFSLQLCDYRLEFSQWWTKEMKTVKLPAQGTVFDYYLEPQSRKFLPWSDLVPPFEMEPQTPLQVRISDAQRLKSSGNCAKAV